MTFLSAAWALCLALPMAGLAQYAESQQARPNLAVEDYSIAGAELREPFTVEHYVLEVDLSPQTHILKGKALIRFRALENLNSVDFELHNNLFPTNIADEEDNALMARRTSDRLRIQVNLGRSLSKGQTATISFEYEGPLADADYSPLEGVQLGYVGPEGSYLLYPARWFPLAGYTINRYTADLHLTVPVGSLAVSGGQTAEPVAAGDDKITYSFTFPKPEFPGSIAVVDRQADVVQAEGLTMRVYFSDPLRHMAQAYGEEAAKMVRFFSSKFGPPPVADLSIVEIDDKSLGGYAGPGVVFLASRAIGSQVNYRLLAHEIAQQWWRGLVSPATPADLWLDNGVATYCEALYLEHLGGAEALERRMEEMYIEALIYDTVPIRSAGRLADFSPEFKSIVYDKGGAVLHMLRWVIGDDAFFRAFQGVANRFAFSGATTDDFRAAAEQASGQELRPFFLQWMESTGASDFESEYVVYRVQDGFKVVGQIHQDMDTFSMPLEVRVETDGEPVTERVQVTGRSSEFSISTFGQPRKIVLDPEGRVLRFNDDIRVRVAVSRGEQAVQARDFSGALEEYQKAIDINRISSLAHYRVGEVFFLLRNYQSSANAFREALNGDLEPPWTEVWSHIYLGKIFDVTGQRERAVNEYQQAVRTKDETQGAQEEANRYLQQPYERLSDTDNAG